MLRGGTIVAIGLAIGCSEPRTGDLSDGALRDAAVVVGGPTIPWLGEGRPPIARPEVPWLEAGGPQVAPPAIDWLERGHPPVAPPAIAPCPEGWREIVDSAGPTACEAWPASSAADACAEPDQTHLPGTAGCASVGRVCPGGDGFPSAIPPGAVFFVRAGAVGGDGSRAAPFSRIMEAITAAGTAPATIVIAPGTYDEDVVLRDGLTLEGACTYGVILRSSRSSETEGTISIRSGSARVRQLRIQGSARLGILARGAGTALDIESVAIDDVLGRALMADDRARVTARRTLVRTVRPPADGRCLGALIDTGAMLDASELAFVEACGVGVLADNAGAITIRDSVVRHTRTRPDGTMGRGVGVQRGGTLDGSRLVVEDNRGVGVAVLGADSRVTLDHAIIRRTTPSGDDGSGIYVSGGARAELRRTLIEHNLSGGIVALGTVTTSDVLVRDIAVRSSDGLNGVGLIAGQAATVTLERSSFARAQLAGLFAEHAGTTVTATDLLIADTTSPPGRDGGRGVHAQAGARVVIERGRILRDQEFGVFVVNASVSLDDVSIEGTRGQARTGAGAGIAVGRAGALTARRVLVADVAGNGMIIQHDGSIATLEDLEIRDTNEVEALASGRCLAIESGASLVLQRARLARCSGTAVLATGDSTRLDAADLAITGVVRGTTTAAQGRGVTIQLGAGAVIRRLTVDLVAEVGIFVATASATVEDTAIRPIRAPGEGSTARAVAVSGAGSLTVTRGLFEGAGDVAALASEHGTSLSLTDVVVRDVWGLAGGELGAGLVSQEGASFTASRLSVERCHLAGLFFSGGTGQIEDLTVREIRPQSRDDRGGAGLVAQLGASVVARRVDAEDCTSSGIVSIGGASLTLEDARISGTQSTTSHGGGSALQAAYGGSIVARRVLAERNREAGLITGHDGASLVADDLLVRNTMSSKGFSGSGLVSVEGGSLVVRHFLVDSSELCSAHVAGTGALSLFDGELARASFGVCVDNVERDLTSFLQEVRFTDIGMSLAVTDRPPPAPSRIPDVEGLVH